MEPSPRTVKGLSISVHEVCKRALENLMYVLSSRDNCIEVEFDMEAIQNASRSLSSLIASTVAQRKLLLDKDLRSESGGHLSTVKGVPTAASLLKMSCDEVFSSISQMKIRDPLECLLSTAVDFSGTHRVLVFVPCFLNLENGVPLAGALSCCATRIATFSPSKLIVLWSNRHGHDVRHLVKIPASCDLEVFDVELLSSGDVRHPEMVRHHVLPPGESEVVTSRLKVSSDPSSLLPKISLSDRARLLEASSGVVYSKVWSVGAGHIFEVRHVGGVKDRPADVPPQE